MRLLAAMLFACLTVPLASADDKDEAKAKETAVAFLKAVKAKDLDAVMKTVDVPFLTVDQDGVKVIEKVEDLKAMLKPLLEKVQPDKITPTEVGKPLDADAARKVIEKELEPIEKTLGKSGWYMVFVLQDGKEQGRPMLVCIKDGKAAVVMLPK
jgi:limonene-1,2-epoxide hydrolase